MSRGLKLVTGPRVDSTVARVPSRQLPMSRGLKLLAEVETLDLRADRQGNSR